MNSNSTYYYTSDSYFQEEQIIGFFHIKKEGDANNRIELTATEIRVTRNGVKHTEKLESIKSIELKKRRLILPFVVGGILLTLVLLAVFHRIGNPLLLSFLGLTGFYLFYLGNEGRHFIEITGRETSNIHLPESKVRLASYFTKMVNNIKNGSSSVVYLPQLQYKKTNSTKTIKCPLMHNYSSLKAGDYLVVNTVSVRSRISIDITKSGFVWLSIEKPINSDAILGIVEVA